MSLIVIHHTIADNFPVNPATTANSATRIVQGAIVGLESNTGSANFGYLSLPSATAYPLGIAGDNFTDEYKTSPYSAQVVVAASGAKRYTQDRVSDLYNQTLASGLMSVYIGTGVFATDQYLTTDTFVVGAPVYTTTAGVLTANAGSGSLARSVGYVKKVPSSYPSGIPGADTDPVYGAAISGSISLGQFLTFVLSI